MQRDWSPLSNTQMQIYRDLCPDDQYRVFKMDFDLPGVSKGLTDQCPVVLMASSRDENGRVYFMANLHRPDPKDPKGNAIDQMPFGFVFDNDSPMLSGALIQHGNWDDRTTYPAASAWDDVVHGISTQYAALGIVPTLSAGSIYDLHGTTQQGAFCTLINALSAKASEVIRQQQASVAPIGSSASITRQDNEGSPETHSTETHP